MLKKKPNKNSSKGDYDMTFENKVHSKTLKSS